jgi:DNA-binding CsgD family transcriptional regulator
MYPVAAASVLAHALMELGNLAGAREALAGEHPERRGAEWTMWLGARGRLLLLEHDWTGALGALEECGRLLAQYGVPSRPTPWRSRAALAAAALGDQARADRLVVDELEHARRVGAPRQIGVALRTAGLLAGQARGVALLREAVDTLARSDAQLELARALVDLGAALRRGGERAASREPLRQGLELAHRFGAAPLVSQAQEELKATGARPRRLVLTGAASLTASERRVAEMAATGLTNRQIAQSLFVTTKAVEFHLRHAYQKLDIQGRRQLATALADG